ncbi:MAG: hypothetical protein JEZ12_11525 [Desulfobacterium sp.]|nr:hypothetical protein [Desulfobacterium sp.]
MTAVSATSTQDILAAYELGKTGDLEAMTLQINSCTNPIQAFACVAAFFAGEQETIMGEKLEEYEAQHNEYKECLQYSKEAHEGKSETVSNKYSYSGSGFDDYMNKISDGKYSSKMDKGNDGKHNKEEWQSFADVINQQKDMESTDLNKLSTEMDMAVKDSSEAEQMVVNAVKKMIELMTTQGKGAGG